MSRSAWAMLAVTWAVIAYFTARFFWKVLTAPPRPDGEPGDD